MKRHSIQYNFIMNFILSASAILFPLITFPYVSRILEPSGTGKVAFATSMVSYFSMIAMLGIPTYGVRAVARSKSRPKELKKTVLELLIINAVMTVIAYLFFFISLFLVPSMASDKTLMLICSAGILLNAIGVTWFFQGMEEYTWITLVSVIFKIISVITMFLFIHSSSDYLWYGVMSVLSGSGSGIVNILYLPRFLAKGPVRLNPVRHLKPILVFFAMTVATTIYTNLDTVMLGMMKGDYEVGLYNAAIKIKVLLVTLITSLGTVLLPRLSEYAAKGNRKEFYRVVSKAVSFVLLFSIPVVLFGMIYSKDCLLLLSGSAYLPAASSMQILMPTIALIGLSNITGIQVLVPLGKENSVLISVILGALVDLILNLMLIPARGAAGAAIGTLAAEITVLIFQAFVLARMLPRILRRVEWKPVLSGTVVFVIVLLACRSLISLHPFADLIISGCICFAAYLIVLLVMHESILSSALGKVLKKRAE